MTERLQFISVHEQAGLPVDLTVQLDGGGARQEFPHGLPVGDVCYRLRALAELLERGANERSSPIKVRIG